MAIQPTNIELADDHHLQIAWSDGQVRRYSFREIIDHCPCATCREKRSAAEEKASNELLPVIKQEDAQPLRLESVQPVGSYAYNIFFNTGCRSGIYTFDRLRELGEEVSPAEG